MSTITSRRQDVAPPAEVQPALTFLRELSQGFESRDFAVRFWNGWTWEPDAGQEAKCTLVLKHPGAVRQMFWRPNKAAFGEAYIYDDFDIEGDVLAIFRWIRYLQLHKPAGLNYLRKAAQILRMPNQSTRRQGRGSAALAGSQHSESRDKQAIQYHYDEIPSEFYAVILDKYMQYTCGYFASPDDDIDTAQERKLDYICRKLRLRPGERLIDFGCGWGGLITFAAKHYGVQAVGVTISKEQMAWATRLIEQEGVGDRCRLEFCDYRKVPEAEKYDKAVSVGFIEHLGERMMPTFFGKVRRLLRPNGLYLHHGITLKPFSPYPDWRAFTVKYVFPDGELVPINRTVDQLAKAGFEVRDVESLREHYMLTLDRWLRRLEASADQVRELTDEVTYRIFRIYLAGALSGFRWGIYNLHQTLVVNSGEDVSGLPLARADWYV
ncbi:MAG TPA: cyclopropane-fatty-acyl-phospholipid synthase family protein [Pirellulaceae bacterium]|nr:cyclopropane-fatty-acyl-phospholipid synthase family protein [Pirellulaceae bacterium]